MSFTVDALSATRDGTPHGRRVGEYPTYDEAVAAARPIIDEFLYREYRRGAAHGVTAAKLFALYRRVGEHPVVLRKTETSTVAAQFDHLEYAKKRCAEICSGKPPA
jgi:hypothetical protein